LKDFKGSGYIALIKKCIYKPKTFKELRETLIRAGMLPGSYDALLQDFKRKLKRNNK